MKKRLVYGGIVFIWIFAPLVEMTLGVLSTNITSETCDLYRPIKIWHTEHGHHQRNLCTVGLLQQLCCIEVNHLHAPFLCIPSTTDDYAHLLLQNCLHHEAQSKPHIM